VQVIVRRLGDLPYLEEGGSLQSRILMLCAYKKLDIDNKEEELVDVALGSG
jgi:hypothetical protein